MKTLADIKKIAVLGAGTMGPGIAQTYAMGGYQVTMWTRSEKTRDKAIAALRSPWLHALLERMRIERCYSAYYLPCRWRSVRLIFTLAEAKRTGSPMFGKLDWAGYYLLGGRLRRD